MSWNHPVRDEKRRQLTNEDEDEFYDDIETCHGIFREAIKMRRPRIINETDETRNILCDEVKSSCLGHRVGFEQITLAYSYSYLLLYVFTLGLGLELEAWINSCHLIQSTAIELVL